MAIELNITPEDIDRLVRESIMKAGFGTAVEKAVTNAIKADAYDGGPVGKAVSAYVGEVASQLIRERFADKIKDAVIAAIEKKVTQEFIDTVVAISVDKMVSAANRY